MKLHYQVKYNCRFFNLKVNAKINNSFLLFIALRYQ